MELTATHLRYLLAIYGLAQKKAEVGAAEVAKAVRVSRPSVTRMLGNLMERGLLERERYGKIYLTDTGLLLAKRYSDRVTDLRGRVLQMGLQLTEEEVLETACLLAASLPERVLERAGDTAP